MSSNKWGRIPMREAALIIVGAGLTAWFSPQLDLFAVVCIVLLARFRGRVQSLVAALSFSLLALVSAIANFGFTHSHTDFIRLFAAIGAVWLCVLFASNVKTDSRRPLNSDDSRSTQDELWESLLKIFPGWMWLARPDGTPEFASPAALAYTGLAAEDALTKPYACVHPDDRQLRADYWKKLVETEMPGEVEMRIRGADGNYRWFAARSYPIRDASGRLERWININWDIDDRKKAEQQIGDQLTQLNLLGERFPGFLWKALPDGRVTYINSYCEDYLGMTAEEAAADWGRLIHPDDRDEVMRRWTILVNGGQWHDHVHRLVGKDGQYRWFQSRITAIRDESGKVVALHGLMMDAHEMVSAKSAVTREEKQLRRLVDAMPAMIWRADPTGRIDRWNRTMIETIGKPWDTSASFDLMSKIESAQAEDVKGRWAKSVRLGIPYEDTYRILGNDGKYHWHLVRAQAIRDDGGNIINWYGVHTDIDALKEAESFLQTREHQLLGIIDTVPSMLWASAPTGEATHISRRLLEFSGCSMEDFLDLGWEKLLHPDDFEYTAKAFFRSIQTGESFSSVHRLRRADGEYRWHHSMGEPLRDSHGMIIQWYGLSVDIDERKRAEDHLRETRAKLNKASKIAMVAELSASIAHELNQPLMSVMANAQASKRWLAATPPNLEEAAASIDRIVRDARSADQTMQNIRAIFKRESFERKDANLPEIINEAVRLVQEDPNKRRVPVQSVFQEALPLVFVDPLLIQEVFINLICNAIEAMGTGPREPLLTIKAAISDDQEVAIEVIDNGPGVEDPEKIFDAFVTTKGKGMGIGLAVSRSIVEAHEGGLWAANNSDFGATFTVRIPLPKTVSAF
ncbi:PAS domain-containing protein [Collimonas silvisoli]|uniref:PAS domain-containing protein n=1 Tax=Collimonas silvisoli TaxID=2825884 RepID=UPI001B8C1126|nr:PAS domain-containing protein [Collimonas silvisoli]